MDKTDRTGIVYLSFTERGNALAEYIRGEIGGETACLNKKIDKKILSLDEWTKEAFANREALIYIGAAGIAVRAIAPYVKSKLSDPAVIVIDEYGRFIIPILSGHLGGANELAKQIAEITQGAAVITTATDINQIFAVDTWAKSQNCAIINPEYIKNISSRLLHGEKIKIYSVFEIEIEKTPPENIILLSGANKIDNIIDSNSEIADVIVDIKKSRVDRKELKYLALAPRIFILGVGCRRGIGVEILERRFNEFCRKYDLYPEAFFMTASIDRKASEPGLSEFCRNHGWQSRYFSASELRSVPGKFHASEFVRRETGVDNICERAAVLASDGGNLVICKTAGEGVTFAAARRDYKIKI